MGYHLLPIEQGRHLRLPRRRHVCRLCHTGALCDERHMLLECPALADLRDEYSPLVAECTGVMARLVWARNQPMVSRDIIACLDGMSCCHVFDCPRFGAIRAQYSNLFQDAEGSMRLFMWHKDQKAVSHCLTAILQMAQT